MRMLWVTALDTPQSCQHGTVRATESREEVHHQGRIRPAPRGVPAAPERRAAAGDARGDRGRGARRPERELRVQAREEEAARDRREAAPVAEAARVVRGG